MFTGNLYEWFDEGGAKATLLLYQDDGVYVHPSKYYDENDVIAGREYVQAFIGFVVYSHHLYKNIITEEEHGVQNEKCGHKH